MSADQRNIARLPFEIFDGLTAAATEDHSENCDDQDDHQEDPTAPNSLLLPSPKSPEECLREMICVKLKAVPWTTMTRPLSLENGTTKYQGVQTVGTLLQMTPAALLNALDPLLTYGTYTVHFYDTIVPFCRRSTCSSHAFPHTLAHSFSSGMRRIVATSLSVLRSPV